MILPYLTVLGDSFRAALASRVLWAALIALWCLLAVLAPIGYREDFTTDFDPAAITDPQRLASMLSAGLSEPLTQSTAVARVAGALPAGLRRQLAPSAGDEQIEVRAAELAAGLNAILDRDAWYDPDAWTGAHRLSEQRQLDALDDQQLSQSLKRRRARLRIESVFPGVFRMRDSRSVMVTYAGWDFPSPLPGDKDRFVTTVNQFVMPLIIEWTLGFGLTLVGILVTASIIPDMLQPGSLHLLLSKPVSRPLLLLSKYVGGCAFVFLCVVQLIIGLYLIAGIRLDIWNPRLLLCIPVAVFSFAVFYSISLVAALWWRSSILAVGITLICGTLFFVLGFLFSLSDAFIRDPNKLHGVVLVGQTPVAATAGGGLVRYDAAANQWSEIIAGNAMGLDLTLSPVGLSDEAAATAVVKEGRLRLLGGSPSRLLIAGESNGWQPEPSLTLPPGTTALIPLDRDQLLAMTSSQLVPIGVPALFHRSGAEVAEGSQPASAADSVSAAGGAGTSGTGNLLQVLVDLIGDPATNVDNILPPQVSLSAPRDVVISRDGAAMWIYSSGRLTRLRRPDAGSDSASWTVTASTSLPGEASLPTELELSGSVILVSRQEQPLVFLDADALTPLGSVALDSAFAPTATAGLGDGRFAVATSNGEAQWVGPVGNDRQRFAWGGELPGDDVHWLGVDRHSGRLLVVHGIDQLDVLDTADLTVLRSIRPQLGRWRALDRYVITPLRLIVPQTGELGETMAAMISGKSGVAVPGGPEQGRVIQYHVFRPLLSCTAFIAVMLTIGCVYFSTRDF